MLHGHGGIVFGSDTAGGIRNVTASNCVFNGTDRGIRIKTKRGRGGCVEDIRICNIIMRNVLCPVTFNLFYRCGGDPGDACLFSPAPQPVTEKTPIVRNITLSHITARNILAAATFFYSLPEMPLAHIRMSDVELELNTEPENRGGEPDLVYGLDLMKETGIYYKYVDNLVLADVRIVKNDQRFCLNHILKTGSSGVLPED